LTIIEKRQLIVCASGRDVAQTIFSSLNVPPSLRHGAKDEKN